MLFQQLDRHIAVRLDPGLWQALGSAQAAVVIQHTVMRQGKGGIPCHTKEGMVVPVPGCSALCCHSGMAHDRGCIVTDPDLEPMSWNRPLMDEETVPQIIGDPGGIRPPGLALRGQDMKDLGFILAR